MCKLEKWLALPYNLHPMPTDEEIDDSLYQNYYFGFYVRYLEIRDFAIRYNDKRRPCTFVTTSDMFFIEEMLSRIMVDDYAVFLRSGIVTQEHKNNNTLIEEPVGEDAFVIVVLSTKNYRSGYRPSNREVKDIGRVLKRKPCWWEAADDK